jgi:hypothetical protein
MWRQSLVAGNDNRLHLPHRVPSDASTSLHGPVERDEEAERRGVENDCGGAPAEYPSKGLAYVVFSFADKSRQYVSVKGRDDAMTVARPRTLLNRDSAEEAGSPT